MLLWLLIGSRATVEDLCGYLSHSGSRALGLKLVRHFSDCSDSECLHKIPLLCQLYCKEVVGELWAAMLKTSYNGSLLQKQYNT